MLQYITGTEQIASCPPQDATPKNQEAWRWVFRPLTASSFRPVAVANPPRLHRAEDPMERCSCWALSMYASYEQGAKAFIALEKKIPRARKIFGDAIAGGMITPAHGVCTVPQKNGHFDLHPFIDIDLVTAFPALEEFK